MRKRLIWMWIVCWSLPPAWADHRMPTATRVHLGHLTSEMKQAVPELEGCDDTHGTITCRRLTGDFTEDERLALESALAAHDPTKPIPSDEQEIPLSDFGGIVGGLAGTASLVIVARKKRTP